MASDARFPCSICDRTFKHNSTLKLHLETHSSVKFDCTLCSASYKHSYNLTTHMKTHRTGGDEGEGTRHKCDMCSKSFKNKSYLKSHRQTHLNGTNNVLEAHGSQFTVNTVDMQRPKPWRCEQCCLSFQTKSGLQAHDEAAHQNIRYDCKFCPKGYTDKMSLYRHGFDHINLEPFNCSHCEFKTRTKQTLVNHLEKNHGIQFDKNIHSCKISSKEVIDYVRKTN